MWLNVAVGNFGHVAYRSRIVKHHAELEKQMKGIFC